VRGSSALAPALLRFESVKMLSFVFLSLLLGGASINLAACGREKGSDVVDSQDLGEASFALVVQGGIVLGSVTYTVSGPSAFSRMGSFDVSHSAGISGLISAIPAGGPYTVTLGSTSADGTSTCGGTGTFSVMAHQTTAVTVHLTCHEPTKLGSVLLTGDVNVCARIDGISATPDEVTVGSALALVATAHDSDAAPAPLTYAWSAPSGTFSSATAPSPTFTCTVPGPVTLSVTVSDGDLTVGCADTQTVQIICSP
jgi:hypothetical protein